MNRFKQAVLALTVLALSLGFTACQQAEQPSAAPEEQAVEQSAETETGAATEAATEDAALYERGKAQIQQSCEAACHQAAQASNIPADKANGLCTDYCGCAYDRISQEVPYQDFIAFGQNQAQGSTEELQTIMTQCSNASKQRAGL